RHSMASLQMSGAQEIKRRLPRTPVEEIIAGIWRQVLRVEAVGLSDDFFELGGHSLLATQVVSRIQEALQVELPLRSLFEAKTVEGLAQWVDRDRRETRMIKAPPMVPVERTGPMPASFAQQRQWFLDRLEPGSPVYNMPDALRLRGPLDRDA